MASKVFGENWNADVLDCLMEAMSNATLLNFALTSHELYQHAKDALKHRENSLKFHKLYIHSRSDAYPEFADFNKIQQVANYIRVIDFQEAIHAGEVETRSPEVKAFQTEFCSQLVTYVKLSASLPGYDRITWAEEILRDGFANPYYLVAMLTLCSRAQVLHYTGSVYSLYTAISSPEFTSQVQKVTFRRCLAEPEAVAKLLRQMSRTRIFTITHDDRSWLMMREMFPIVARADLDSSFAENFVRHISGFASVSDTYKQLYVRRLISCLGVGVGTEDEFKFRYILGWPDCGPSKQYIIIERIAGALLF